MTVKSVLFLHGFNSHPGTFKAQVTKEACAHLPQPPIFSAPALSGSPARALLQAEAALTALPSPILVIGSSLGGFLALCLAARHTLQAVALLNPALDPEPFMLAHMGETFDNPVTGERIVISPSMLDEIGALRPAGVPCPERTTAWLSSADEVLDHVRTRRWLVGCTCIDCPGDNHRLLSYPDHITDVLALGGLTMTEKRWK